MCGVASFQHHPSHRVHFPLSSSLCARLDSTAYPFGGREGTNLTGLAVVKPILPSASLHVLLPAADKEAVGCGISA